MNPSFTFSVVAWTVLVGVIVALALFRKFVSSGRGRHATPGWSSLRDRAPGQPGSPAGRHRPMGQDPHRGSAGVWRGASRRVSIQRLDRECPSSGTVGRPANHLAAVPHCAAGKRPLTGSFCHEQKVGGVHSALSCVKCHGGHEVYRTRQMLQKPACPKCHPARSSCRNGRQAVRWQVDCLVVNRSSGFIGRITRGSTDRPKAYERKVIPGMKITEEHSRTTSDTLILRAVSATTTTSTPPQTAASSHCTTDLSDLALVKRSKLRHNTQPSLLRHRSLQYNGLKSMDSHEDPRARNGSWIAHASVEGGISCCHSQRFSCPSIFPSAWRAPHTTPRRWPAASDPSSLRCTS